MNQLVETIPQYSKVELTESERQELIRLMLGVNFVETQSTFNMDEYATQISKYGVHNMNKPLNPSQIFNECGTCACLLGNAPLFCQSKPLTTGDWGTYGHSLFGSMRSGGGLGGWSFLFHHGWPNSWSQAVARLHLILTKGIPIGYSTSDRYTKPSDLTLENYGLKYGVTVEEVYDRACELTK